MPGALLATTLMIALGQTPVAPGAPMQGGPAAPAYGPSYAPGPGYGPDAQYGPAPTYGSQPVYGSGLAPGQDPGYGPNANGPNAYGPNGYGPDGYGAPGSLNNAYGAYRLSPGFGEGAGTPTHGYAYPNYDAYEPWVHGQWQELPAFGGHAYFRPYNYRHVYVQSEIAVSWGTSAVMPYSHEYFRRPREQGIYEQRTSATTGRTGLSSVAYRQQPRLPQPQNNDTISRTAGVRPAAQQTAPVRQATSGPSLFPRSRN